VETVENHFPQNVANPAVFVIAGYRLESLPVSRERTPFFRIEGSMKQTHLSIPNGGVWVSATKEQILQTVHRLVNSLSPRSPVERL